MKSTKTIASHVYTVIKTFRGIHGTFKQAATFANEYDAQQYAWACVNLLNACWAEVHEPNGERISIHMAL